MKGLDFWKGLASSKCLLEILKHPLSLEHLHTAQLLEKTHALPSSNQATPEYGVPDSLKLRGPQDPTNCI